MFGRRHAGIRIASILMLGAIAAEALGKRATWRVVDAIARRVPQPGALSPSWSLTGILLCSLATWAWLYARSRGEVDRYRVILILFVIYVVLAFALVA